MVCIKKYIPNSLPSQSRGLLLYAKSWQWRYINLNATLQKKTIEALKRVSWWKKCYFSMKRSCYCGKTRKHPNFGIHFLDVFDERNLRFTTVPYSFKKQNVLLRARFPVRRDVYGIVLPTSYGNFMEFHGISINGEVPNSWMVDIYKWITRGTPLGNLHMGFAGLSWCLLQPIASAELKPTDRISLNGRGDRALRPSAIEATNRNKAAAQHNRFAVC